MRDNLSLMAKNLKYKLKISLMLMIILPFLVYLYILLNYIQSKKESFILMIITLIISICGFLIIKDIFRRFLLISNKAKKIVEDNKILPELKRDYFDEIGDLVEALDILTQRIKIQIKDLEVYGEKTSLINLEIQKKLLMLNILLQINTYISERRELNQILKILIEKIRLLTESQDAFILLKCEEEQIYLPCAINGIDEAYYNELKLSYNDYIVERMLSTRKPFIVDKQYPIQENAWPLFYKFQLKNFVFMPLYSKNELKGILFIGNNRNDFVFSAQDLELLEILAKQIIIAIEYDYFWHQIEISEIKDSLTGFYNRTFIYQRLNEEIKRGMIYHRPCALIVFKIVNFKQYQQEFGIFQTNLLIKKIANLIRESLTSDGISYLGRIGEDKFIIILPEKSKHRARKIAEEIHTKIKSRLEEEEKKEIILSKAVSENPLDGTEAEELISYCERNLR